MLDSMKTNQSLKSVNCVMINATQCYCFNHLSETWTFANNIEASRWTMKPVRTQWMARNGILYSRMETMEQEHGDKEEKRTRVYLHDIGWQSLRDLNGLSLGKRKLITMTGGEKECREKGDTRLHKFNNHNHFGYGQSLSDVIVLHSMFSASSRANDSVNCLSFYLFYELFVRASLACVIVFSFSFAWSPLVT